MVQTARDAANPSTAKKKSDKKKHTKKRTGLSLAMGTAARAKTPVQKKQTFRVDTGTIAWSRLNTADRLWLGRLHCLTLSGHTLGSACILSHPFPLHVPCLSNHLLTMLNLRVLLILMTQIYFNLITKRFNRLCATLPRRHCLRQTGFAEYFGYYTDCLSWLYPGRAEFSFS